jgi:hypothetical protein
MDRVFFSILHFLKKDKDPQNKLQFTQLPIYIGNTVLGDGAATAGLGATPTIPVGAAAKISGVL